VRVTLLFNPVAGRGHAVSTARELAQRLVAAGHTSRLTPTTADARPGWLAGPLAESDLLVVVGGDGAVRMAAAEMLGGNVPIYHFPLGTENLFSREFGSRADPLQLLASIERDRRQSIDVARVADDDFLLMLSVGFDAAVVADLSARRRGPIRHASYLAPIFRQLVRWQPPLLTIEADGVRIVDRQRGFAVVANSAQYAVRINPAPRASMIDGALDVVFFPCASRISVPGWMLRCRLGRQANDGRMISHRAAAVRILCDPPHPIQIDGDLPADPLPRETMDISLRPRALPVLLAAQ
jgi:diacylglycerol kinase (ATP)